MLVHKKVNVYLIFYVSMEVIVPYFKSLMTFDRNHLDQKLEELFWKIFCEQNSIVQVYF